jgi:glycosyltransferase involved in cell wall biosynthesis
MKTSIIICTYNEENTISSVVKSCCDYSSENEVIVVDDGSTDSTEIILSKMQKTHYFKYEKLVENKGKSYAMAHGVEKFQNNLILFMDADLSNITKEHFDKLLSPLKNDEADMVLGQPSETLIDYRINPFVSLTGQRALRKKDILPIINEIRNTRFGVETYINLYYRAQGKRIKYILLDGLHHPTKYSKTTPLKATEEFIHEGQEIAITLMKNYDLIVRRLENNFDSTKHQISNTLNEIQNEINERIKHLMSKRR